MIAQLAHALTIARNWSPSDVGSVLIFPAVATLFVVALALTA